MRIFNRIDDALSEGDDYQKHKEWRAKNKDKVSAQNKRARHGKNRDKYLKQRRAHQAVYEKKKNGDKDKPKKCANCGKETSDLQLNHNKGYTGKSKTSGNWLCPKCHIKADGRTGKGGKISKGMKEWTSVQRRKMIVEERGLKVWLDDERPAPPGWIHVRTPDEAIHYLKSGNVTEISLDHDLGLFNERDEQTGYNVLLWIEEQQMFNNFDPPKMAVHSANSGARPKMLSAINAIDRRRSMVGEPEVSDPDNSTVLPANNPERSTDGFRDQQTFKMEPNAGI